MALYCGMDLHSTNTWVFIGNDQDRAVVSRRFSNSLEGILEALETHRDELAGIAVE